MAGFAVVTLKLKEMYQMITLGGDAELELVDSLDPFRCRTTALWAQAPVLAHKRARTLVTHTLSLSLSLSHSHSLAHHDCTHRLPQRGHRVQRAASQEVLEEHREPFGG